MNKCFIKTLLEADKNIRRVEFKGDRIRVIPVKEDFFNAMEVLRNFWNCNGEITLDGTIYKVVASSSIGYNILTVDLIEK